MAIFSKTDRFVNRTVGTKVKKNYKSCFDIRFTYSLLLLRNRCYEIYS